MNKYEVRRWSTWGINFVCESAYQALFAPFTFTDVSVEVDCVAFLLTSSESAPDANDADMHNNKLHNIL